MLQSAQVGDRVRVQVSRFRGDAYTIYPMVPAEVVYRSMDGQGLRFSVRLRADAAPGWVAGDTYRARPIHLYPPD